MSTITTKDGVEIFYKDWGKGQPIVFSHGWPLSADDWDNQMLFFLKHGYRVIAHDRRGHGRSSQTSDGHDMDHYADDLAALTAHLDLKNAIHVGHSTGGGEVSPLSGTARRKPRREGGPDQRGAAADGEDAGQSGRPARRRCSTVCRRSSLAETARTSISISRADPSMASTGRARKPSEAIIQNWWRQGMMGERQGAL